MPQVAYYFSAYFDLVRRAHRGGDPVDFVVPTGNFGDILAGYFAKELGLPVGKLICASNANNVLTDFLRTGCYDRNRPFYKTVSPSMDILVSSNLERLLYLLQRRCGPGRLADGAAQGRGALQVPAPCWKAAGALCRRLLRRRRDLSRPSARSGPSRLPHRHPHRGGRQGGQKACDPGPP